jgi:hypothetical protein
LPKLKNYATQKGLFKKDHFRKYKDGNEKGPPAKASRSDGTFISKHIKKEIKA